jgi:hypothetical protein
VAIHVTDRLQHAGEMQKLFTEFGCFIRTRLGLHEVSQSFCAPNGMVLLELLDDMGKMNELVARVNAIEGVEAKAIVFTH